MERRRFERVSALAEKEERVLIKTGPEYIAASLVDLSAGGVLLSLPDPDIKFPLGDYCLLFLENGGPKFSVRAFALRDGGDGRIGFRFSSLTSSDQRHIQTKLIRMKIIAARVNLPASMLR